MRVVANGDSSEIMFTLFQHPGIDDHQFAKDAEMVQADLQSLKTDMEFRN